MRAELRSLTTETGDDLNGIVYVEGEEFQVALCASIGPYGQKGEDIFYLTAMSPGAIADEANKGPRLLRHILLMKSFSEKSARTMIEKLCNSTSGEDWNAVALKLSRFMAWEFEDYREAKS